jgi:hypothetical protein
MNNLHRLKNNMKTSSGCAIVLELVEATLREVVVGEVGTAAPEYLDAVPFAIHVAMKLVLMVLICAR